FASLVLQPYFYPKYFADGREVNWIGFLRAFWVDFKSNLREDTVEAKWLNLWSTLVDKLFQMVSKEGEEPKAWMLDNETTCSASLSKPLSNLIPVFDAGCLLAERSGVDRAIYVNFNGTIKDIMESEVTNYLKSIWSEVAQNQGLIFQVDDQFTQCLIKFIKGEDIPSNCSSSTYGDYFKRNLTIPLNLFCPNSNLQGRWKLGDTGYSTPSIVSNAPNNNYDLLYFDSSYTSYIRDTSYRRRSSFIFLGANDGMLHAFRLGYFSDTGDVNKPLRLVDAFNSTSFANIGKEEWAFIPKNAIPYLVWYGHKDYCRIPIIDYRSLIIDASIGGDAQDNKTVNSWRTLLIGVMGFGGKELSNYSSSIFVLDLTDWLKGEANQPTLLWEATLPDKSLTLSFPVVVRRGDADKNGNWYVVIGSGPKNPQATSFVSNPKIYLFDLRNGNKQEIEIPYATSMAVSDLWAVDLDGDYQDDVVYFGTYNTASGNLYRLKLSDLSVSMAFKIERPIFAAPITGAGKSGQIWVYFGTGRFLDGNLDRTFTYNNYFVGFKDGCASGNCPAPYTLADLTDRTNFSYENRTALRTEQICLCEWEACSLKDVVVDATYGGGYPEEPTRGWYHKLTNNATHKEMIYSQPFIFGGNVETLLYRAVNDICKIEGETLLMALCYNTGALCPKPSLPTTQDYFNVVKIPIGPGAPPFGQPFQMSSLSGERGTYTKLVTISLATIEALKQQVQPGYQSRFILWIEK
ncbi:MAG: PilC/PilY family type IV pilus protein, partial [Thermodesulfobacteriaceae bacterium]|nr:PilC/PilY family type IV pilus protein [Thermodesulfobacteriaceae bacterium]